jgi:hypothetical protein
MTTTSLAISDGDRRALVFNALGAALLAFWPDLARLAKVSDGAMGSLAPWDVRLARISGVGVGRSVSVVAQIWRKSMNRHRRAIAAVAGLVAVPAILSPARYLMHLLLVEAAALGVLVAVLLTYRLGRDLIDGAVSGHYERRHLRWLEEPRRKTWFAARPVFGDTRADAAELSRQVNYAHAKAADGRVGRVGEARDAHLHRSAGARQRARRRRGYER